MHLSGYTKNANPSKINIINVCTRNAFHGQYKLAAGDHQVASTAWFGLLGARANDGIWVWNAKRFASETHEESFILFVLRGTIMRHAFV